MNKFFDKVKMFKEEELTASLKLKYDVSNSKGKIKTIITKKIGTFIQKITIT